MAFYSSPPMKPGMSSGGRGLGVRTMGSASYPSCAASAAAHSTDCDDTHSFPKSSKPKGMTGLSPCHHCRTSRLCPSVSPFWFRSFRGRPRGRGADPSFSCSGRRRLTPASSVAKHRPAYHHESSGCGDHRDLSAGLAAAAHTIEHVPQIPVVATHQPTHFNQQRTQQFVPLAADLALSAHRPRFVLDRKSVV